jgi:hypothetical protein
VSLDGAELDVGSPVSGDGGGRPIPGPGPWARVRRWRWRWLAWLALAVTVIIAASASILLTLADDYRPLEYGLDWSGGLSYPGLPAGHGIRIINNFGGIREDIYVPPQRGTFYLSASVMNTGSRAVIIEKVSLPRFSKLVPAGPVRYARQGRPNTSGIPPARRILHNVKLGPYQQIHIAIPVHSWPCAKTRNSGWSVVPRFYVSYRFLFFHHVAALPWGFKDDIIIMHAPFGKPGQPGVFCASR